jgi:hypothetical protein
VGSLKLRISPWDVDAEDFTPDFVPSLEKTLTRSDGGLDFEVADDDDVGIGSIRRLLLLIAFCHLQELNVTRTPF